MKIYKVPSSDLERLRLVPTTSLQPRRAEDSDGSIDGGNRNIIDNPGRMRAMSEGALRVADARFNWHRLLERTLRFNDASAAPVTAAQTGRGWASELRTR